MGIRLARLIVVLAFALAACAGGVPSTMAPLPTDTTAAVPSPTSTAPVVEDSTSATSATATAAPPTAVPATAAPASGAAPIGPTEVATVLSITDGDTIRVDRGHGSERVRYIGINTPEVGDPGGSEATAENARLVEGRQIVLERDVSETDQFDRLLRYIWIHEGATWTFVNLELIERGFAQAATYPPDVRYVDLFVAAQQTARANEVGLWAPAPAPEAQPTDEPDEEPGGNCHPSYLPCLPIVGDLDCPDVRAMGLAPVTVKGPDSYRLDGDHDGLGCE
jgi:micrococcal nuclease